MICHQAIDSANAARPPAAYIQGGFAVPRESVRAVNGPYTAAAVHGVQADRRVSMAVVSRPLASSATPLLRLQQQGAATVLVRTDLNRPP